MRLVRVDGVLSRSTAHALRLHVDDALAAALNGARADVALDIGDVSTQRFGDVMCRFNRHDLKLDVTPPPVRRAKLHAYVDPNTGESAPLISDELKDIIFANESRLNAVWTDYDC